MLTPTDAKDESPKDYLGRVRRATCYSALRTLIKIVFTLLVIAIVLAGIGSLVSATREQDAKELIGLAAAALALFVAIAGYQACVLLIDIADIQLESGRTKPNG
jgi:Na+/proline symporter